MLLHDLDYVCACEVPVLRDGYRLLLVVILLLVQGVTVFFIMHLRVLLSVNVHILTIPKQLCMNRLLIIVLHLLNRVVLIRVRVLCRCIQPLYLRCQI